MFSLVLYYIPYRYRVKELFRLNLRGVCSLRSESRTVECSPDDLLLLCYKLKPLASNKALLCFNKEP